MHNAVKRSFILPHSYLITVKYRLGGELELEADRAGTNIGASDDCSFAIFAQKQGKLKT